MRTWIAEDAEEAVRGLQYFGYRNWDIELTLETYVEQFVEPALQFMQSRRLATIADIGSGYGWLAIAFALRTTAKVIAVDPDVRRLETAQQIATIIGVDDRIEWREGSISQIPIRTREADATFCIEVLEHCGLAERNVEELARVTNDLLMLTTPNGNFPIINHDTGLPFCHWLPLAMRDRYARTFNMLAQQTGNMFWSPSSLVSALGEFERISSFQQFPSYSEFVRCRDRPQQRHEEVSGAVRELRNAYFRLAAFAGKYSFYLLPNLASTFRRKKND
jgi:2-polyprenyl-3-methyl-5-hydroxy-6-metoxy-1,4-benzoquinol methylase